MASSRRVSITILLAIFFITSAFSSTGKAIRHDDEGSVKFRELTEYAIHCATKDGEALYGDSFADRYTKGMILVGASKYPIEYLFVNQILQPRMDKMFSAKSLAHDRGSDGSKPCDVVVHFCYTPKFANRNSKVAQNTDRVELSPFTPTTDLNTQYCFLRSEIPGTSSITATLLIRRPVPINETDNSILVSVETFELESNHDGTTFQWHSKGYDSKELKMSKEHGKKSQEKEAS